MTAAIRVGLIEDNAGDVRLIQELLSEPSAYPIAVRTSGRLDLGLRQLETDATALLLLDLGLPDSNGIETYHRVREHAPALPVIIFSGAVDEELAARAVSDGAQDYLVKGQVDGFQLRRSIRYAIERKRVDELLRVQQTELSSREELLRLLLEATTQGIFGVNAEGSCTFCNPTGAKVLGYQKPSDLLGQPMHEVVHGRHAGGEPHPAEECDLCNAWRAGVAFQSHATTFWRTDGQRFTVSLQVSPIMRRDGVAGSVVAFSDVTEHETLETRLRQAQKMESVGRLAGGVAHDFNNLLSVILGWTDIACGVLADGHAAREALEEVRAAGNGAASLTKQLLMFSRQQVVEPAVINVNDAVVAIDKMMRRVIGEDIEFAIHTGEPELLVEGDRGQLDQVLMNLVVNARDAMPRGGRILVEVSGATIEAGSRASEAEVVPGDYVLLSVGDTGTGMSEEVRTRIFEPFFTTKDKERGTGLGLATCYGIAQSWGGHIDVQTELGVGTTFRVYLPRRWNKPAAEPPRVPSRPLGGMERILLVEDEVAVRRMMVRILEADHYQVLSAATGPEAVQVMEREGASLQLVLTDIVLPGGMTGTQVAECARTLIPGVKILFASGYTSDVASLRDVLDQGGAYLQKPFTPESLGRKVRQVLDGDQTSLATAGRP